jgi:hypothetical protein
MGQSAVRNKWAREGSDLLIVSRIKLFSDNDSWIHDKTTGGSDLVNACYHSVKNFLSSSLFSNNVRLQYTKLQFCTKFCMGVKLGLRH